MSTHLDEFVQKSDQLDKEIQTLQRKGAQYSKDENQQWQPTYDLYHFEGSLFIDIELPGVPPEMVELHTESGVITISGTKLGDDEPKGREETVQKRQYGDFLLQFAAPPAQKIARVEERLEFGVLHLKIDMEITESSRA